MPAVFDACVVIFSDYTDAYAMVYEPVQYSLKRFRQKLVNNYIHQNDVARKQSYMVSLTLDEVSYTELYETSASKIMRSFLTRLRNYIKRQGNMFEYVWRCERGAVSTQRLHYHLIITTEFDEDALKEYIMNAWDKCDWSTQDDEWFRPCEDMNKALLYVAKYVSKTSKNGKGTKERFTKEGWERRKENHRQFMEDCNYERWLAEDKWIRQHYQIQDVRKTRAELKYRLWGSSRGWKPVPKDEYCSWEPESKSWSVKRKKTWEEVNFLEQQVEDGKYVCFDYPLRYCWNPYRRVWMHNMNNVFVQNAFSIKKAEGMEDVMEVINKKLDLIQDNTIVKQIIDIVKQGKTDWEYEFDPLYNVKCGHSKKQWSKYRSKNVIELRRNMKVWKLGKNGLEKWVKMGVKMNEQANKAIVKVY